MSENVAVCWVCLATDVRMVRIAGSPLQQVYERLTNSSLESASLPLVACYMCCARLRRCHALMETASRAAQALTELLATNKITKTTLSQINICTNNKCRTLAISKTKYIDVDIDATVLSVPDDVRATDVDGTACPVDSTTNVPDDVKGTVPVSNVNGAVHVYLTTNVHEDVNPTVADDVKPTVLVSNVNATIHPAEVITTVNVDVKPTVPALDVHATAPGEIEFQQDWGADVKVEIKEEALDVEETTLLPNLTSKHEESGSDEDDIPLKSLSEQKRGALGDKNETGGAPASSIPTNRKVDEGKTPISGTQAGGRFVCDYCQRHFQFASNFKRHLRVHTNERPHQCNICQTRFKLLATLKKHYKIHTDESHTCDICQRQFKQRCSLRRHLRTHTGELPYACNKCEKRFNVLSCLKKHALAHTDERPFECNICSSRYKSTDVLKQHVQRVHTGELECHVCRSKFVGKYSLNIHLKQHFGENYSQCNFCNRSFSQRSALKRHLRTHTGERPHSCKICAARFVCYSVLVKHVRTHTGEKPYECDTCGRRFVSRHSLRGHLLTHTGEKPHQCTVCNRRFRLRNSLNRHCKTHSEVVT